jgi:hypothetical protein
MKASKFFVTGLAFTFISLSAFAGGKKECVGSDGQPMPEYTTHKACKKAHGKWKKAHKVHEIKDNSAKAE